MCFDYDEECDIQETRVVKTRTLHKCAGCRKKIAKGSKAICSSGLFDGAWFRYYVCDRCTRLQYAIVEKEIKDGCQWHTAWIAVDDLQEYLSELRSYGEEVKPLGMPTLADCSRYLSDLWLSHTGYARPDETERCFQELSGSATYTD